jgi:hypothetical protein
MLDINSVGDISDSRLYTAPERLEDPEELNAIQMAVSSLELEEDGVEFPSNKRLHDFNTKGRLLKKRRLNTW